MKKKQLSRFVFLWWKFTKRKKWNTRWGLRMKTIPLHVPTILPWIPHKSSLVNLSNYWSTWFISLLNSNLVATPTCWYNLCLCWHGMKYDFVSEIQTITPKEKKENKKKLLKWYTRCITFLRLTNWEQINFIISTSLPRKVFSYMTRGLFILSWLNLPSRRVYPIPSNELGRSFSPLAIPRCIFKNSATETVFRTSLMELQTNRRRLITLITF